MLSDRSTRDQRSLYFSWRRKRTKCELLQQTSGSDNGWEGPRLSSLCFFFPIPLRASHPLGALGGQWANKASAGTRQWFIRERRLGLLFQPLTSCIWRWWAYYMHISSWKRKRRGAWEIQPGHSLRDVEAPPGWILGWLTLPQELPGYWCWSLLSVSLFLLWCLHKLLGYFLNVMCYKNIAE